MAGKPGRENERCKGCRDRRLGSTPGVNTHLCSCLRSNLCQACCLKFRKLLESKILINMRTCLIGPLSWDDVLVCWGCWTSRCGTSMSLRKRSREPCVSKVYTRHQNTETANEKPNLNLFRTRPPNNVPNCNAANSGQMDQMHHDDPELQDPAVPPDPCPASSDHQTSCGFNGCFQGLCATRFCRRFCPPR